MTNDMFWLLAVAAFIVLVLLFWFLLRTLRLKSFIRLLNHSTGKAAKGESFRPMEPGGPGEVKDVILHVNEIYTSLKKYQPVADENIALKKEREELKETLTTYKNAVDYLNVIGELGQKISSTLSLQDVISNLANSIGSMMDASKIEIKLNFNLPVRDSAVNDITYSTEFANWSLTNGKDIFLQDVEKNYARYIPKLPFGATDKIPQSLICCPMIEKDRIIGVISVVSFQKNAFSSYHFDMIKALLPYATLAIENARGYEQLAIAQQQLVQQEKMASLGQLTAGVAHEINNPINFVSANVTPLKRDIEDIITLLEKYSSVNEENYSSKSKEILDFSNEIDLKYTIEEIKSLIKGIEEGSKRTAEIVKGLRNFSRLDEEDMKKANINEGLTSTLVLLHNKLNQHQIQVTKSFGDLPEIECYPGQLNQVFMNILSNAIDAIGDNGTITITTSKENDQLKISIHDTGQGMSDEMQKKIFDPFFTTKDVGKGTGLGLSISYGIIEKHSGKIEVKSEIGKGSEFVITLPV